LLLVLTDAAGGACVYAQTLPPDEVAVFQIPLHISLAPLAERLEKEIPLRAEKLDAYELEPKQRRYGVKYRATREKMRLNATPDFLEVSTRVHYGIRACRRTYNIVSDDFAMWPCVSCGLDEAPRTAELTVHSKLSWNPAWQLHSSTTAMPARFPNRCRVTLFDVDLTERALAPWIDSELRAVVKLVDRDTPRLTSIRAEADRIWRELHRPQQISATLWLLVEPLSASFSPMTGAGMEATTTLTVLARTRAVSALPPTYVIRPLPPLGSGYKGESFRVPLPAELTYEEATQRLLAQRELKTTNGDIVRLGQLKLEPLSPTRLRINTLVEVFRGGKRRFNGQVSLDGTIQLDEQKQQLRLTHVDFVAKTSNPFFKLADRFIHERLRSQLESAAVWDLKPIAETLKKDASRALTRPLSKEAQLTTAIDSIAMRTVTLGPKTFVVNVLATGRASIAIKGW
jgi:hypothetical protein